VTKILQKTSQSWWTSGPLGAAPAKAIEPLLEELSQEYASSLDFVKVNLDQAQELGEELEILVVPYLDPLFRKEGSINRHSGSGSKGLLERVFKEYI
jgi:thiol-disulfide isomerase/thioredoxin